MKKNSFATIENVKRHKVLHIAICIIVLASMTFFSKMDFLGEKNSLVLQIVGLIPTLAIIFISLQKNYKKNGNIKFSSDSIQIIKNENIYRIPYQKVKGISFRYNGAMGEGMSKSPRYIDMGHDGAGNILTVKTTQETFKLNILLVNKQQTHALNYYVRTVHLKYIKGVK